MKVVPIVMVKCMSDSVDKRDSVYAKGVVNLASDEMNVVICRNGKVIDEFFGGIGDIYKEVAERHGNLAVELAYYNMDLMDHITYVKKCYGGTVPTTYLLSKSVKVVEKDREYRKFNF